MENAMEASQFPWLTAMVALPALGAALLGLVPALRRSAGRAVALAVSAAELVLALVVAATRFDWSAPASYQVTDSFTWIPQLGISWSLSVSALSLVMVLLATALVPLVLVAG